MHVFWVLVAAVLASFPLSDCSSQPGLLERLEHENCTVIVLMNQRIKDELSRYEDMTFKDLPTRRTFIYKKTKQFTRKSQKCVTKFLNTYQKSHHELTFSSSVVTNTVTIFDATYHVVHSLIQACAHTIQEIAKSVTVPLDTIASPSVVDEVNSYYGSPLENVPWNLDSIGVPAAWQLNVTGKGVVVGIISTGVNENHEALRRQRRESMYWFDAINALPDPYDDVGLGTAAASIAVGSTELRPVGVAPDAQWIACKACNQNGCPEHSLIKCAEFMANPATFTTGSGDDAKACPSVVLWTDSGIGLNPIWLIEATAFFKVMSTIHVVPAGSSSPVAECSSISSSTGIPSVLTLSSFDVNDAIDNSGHRGPVIDSLTLKPNVCAPGMRVLAADNENDSSYKLISSSTIAAAHAAGVAAILKSLEFEAQPEMIIHSLEVTADVITSSDSCGGIEGAVLPNYIVGYGKLNCFKALQLLMA